jgi:hypothetical protein
MRPDLRGSSQTLRDLPNHPPDSHHDDDRQQISIGEGGTEQANANENNDQPNCCL